MAVWGKKKYSNIIGPTCSEYSYHFQRGYLRYSISCPIIRFSNNTPHTQRRLTDVLFLLNIRKKTPFYRNPTRNPKNIINKKMKSNLFLTCFSRQICIFFLQINRPFKRYATRAHFLLNFSSHPIHKHLFSWREERFNFFS